MSALNASGVARLKTLIRAQERRQGARLLAASVCAALVSAAAVLLLGAEMNAVIEHMSAEGKDPGEKEIGEPGHTDEKQHVSGLGRDHSKPMTEPEQ